MGLFNTLQFRRRCPRCRRMSNMETQFKYATRGDAARLENFEIGDHIPWKELGGKDQDGDFSDAAALECSMSAQPEGDTVVERGLPTICDACPPLPADTPLLSCCPLEADIIFHNYRIVGLRRVYRIDTPVRLESDRFWRAELEVLKQYPFEIDLWNAAAARLEKHISEWRRLNRKNA